MDTLSNLAPSRRRWLPAACLAVVLLGLPALSFAQAALPALTATPAPGGGQTYSLSVQTMLLLTSLTFLPAILLMIVAFMLAPLLAQTIRPGLLIASGMGVAIVGLLIVLLL